MYVFLSFFCLFEIDHSNFKYGSLKIIITVVLQKIWHTFELYKHYQSKRWHRNTLSSSPNPLTTLRRKKNQPMPKTPKSSIRNGRRQFLGIASDWLIWLVQVLLLHAWLTHEMMKTTGRKCKNGIFVDISVILFARYGRPKSLSFPLCPFICKWQIGIVRS